MRRSWRLGAWLSGGFAMAALSACSSSASVEFGAPTTIYADAGGDDQTPYPDGAPGPDTGAPTAETGPEDIGAPPDCTAATDGRANVCVRVLRAADGPSINDASKALGLDGKGAVLIGLSAVKPSRDLSFVAQTWYPSESSGSGKLAATDLPKIAELTVPPGTYYAFAVFRDAEPYVRPNLAVGDYIARLVELPMISVGASSGTNVDVHVYPVRGLDVDAQLTATPVGSGAGPLRSWLVDGDKLVGDGGAPCADLASTHVTTVRVFTTYTGSFDLGGGLFDFAPPVDDPAGAPPELSGGTIYASAPVSAKIDPGEWLSPTHKHLDLDKVAPFASTKPSDPSPTCTGAAFAAAK